MHWWRPLLLATAVWLVISWPLARHFSQAIPAGATKRQFGREVLSPMAPGDHLQFLYYVWLFSDFLAGKTPFFYNLYEFNTGDDAARYRPGAYYLPYSLVFAAFHAVGGRAFAWNATALFALCLMSVFAWRLCRRFSDSEWIAAIGTAIALLVPYLWIQLFGGSPAGWGMTFVPMLFYGLDRAARDGDVRGGVLAGLAILFAGMTDTHVFFFGALVTPCWSLLSLLNREDLRSLLRVREWGKLVIAYAPFALFAAAALLQNKLGTRHIAQSHTGGGRALREVALFSPKPQGLWAWRDLDISSHVYIGFVAIALLVTGIVAWIAWSFWEKRRYWRAVFTSLCISVAVAVTAALALGPNGPSKGLLFRAARKAIPGYNLIRQPAKIYTLMPAFLAVGVAFSLQAVRVRRPRAATAIALGAGALAAAEYFLQTQPQLTLLESRNNAYAAVAESAREESRPARAIVLPLWPGDSHYTSVYQHFASQYRIRMINGYRPFVPRDYVENVFERFQSLNAGFAADEQLDELLSRGIDHIILHEDLYPEKVAVFPVTSALAALLDHPRLDWIAKDGPTWAFRILPESSQKSPKKFAGATSRWTLHFPARRIEAERQKRRKGPVIEEGGASGGAFIRLAAEQGEHYVQAGPVSARPVGKAAWLIRVRGRGELEIIARIGADNERMRRFPLDSEEWTWLRMPLGDWNAMAELKVEVRSSTGTNDVDLFLFTAGEWPNWETGEAMTLPAPIFFHAGHIDLEEESVVFRPGHDRRDLVFYGPKLPLSPGRYRIDIGAEVSRLKSGRGGTWIAACPEGKNLLEFELRAGSPASFETDIPSNLPFLLAFFYHGEEEVRIRSVTISRLQ